MAYKCSPYFGMIFEKEKLGHRGSQFVLHLQFCTDNIDSSTIGYILKI